MSVEPSQLCEIAIRAADAGVAAIQRITAAGLLQTRFKQHADDPVTAADLASERAIIDSIRRARPYDMIVAEESGLLPGTSDVQWIIDPLDGTRNLATGSSYYAVSIAAAVNDPARSAQDRIIAGVIHRPVGGCWLATDGTHTIGNVAAANLAHPRDIARARLSFALPRAAALRSVARDLLGPLPDQVAQFDDTGSTASDLMAIATGTRDAYVGFNMPVWDLAAGAGLVRALGGHCLDIVVSAHLSIFIAGVASIADEISRQILGGSASRPPAQKTTDTSR